MISSDKIWEHDPQLRDALEKIMVCAECALLHGCAACGWSESEEYDLSDGKDPVDENGGAIDQWGGYHPPGSSMAYRLARLFKK